MNCSIEDCGRRTFRRGFCPSHYKRQRKTELPFEQFFGCSVEGCDKPHLSLKLCSKHYYRFKRTGDINKVRRVFKWDDEKRDVKNIWYAMKTRCYNPNQDHYERYGGRGIFICDEWLNDFLAFYDYVGERPSPKHSIDRIDNDKGYEPGNVRWALPHQQAVNTGRNRKYPGISFQHNKKGISWFANMTHNGERVLYKRCDTMAEAIQARKEAEAKYLG